MRTPLQFLRLLLAAFVTFCAIDSTRGAGITIITHGYNSNANGWVASMAQDIPVHPLFPGTNCSLYKMVLTYSAGSYNFNITRTGGVAATNSDSGEIIIALDWSQMAGGLSATYNISTHNVAWATAQVMMLTNAMSELGGRPMVELPLHLIGHSRGGSLMNELCRQLGTNGVWIDHLTTLDPHPLNNDGNSEFGMPTDATARSTYQNVLFRDNYWQENFLSFLDPSGEEVAGAYNRQLEGYELAGGYADVATLSVRHSNVHLWYHGTLNFNLPMSDGSAFVDVYERNNWWTEYETYGIIAGMHYSRIGGGDRTTLDRPAGPGTSSVFDGYNQLWEPVGSSSRTRFPFYIGKWPNAVELRVSTNIVERGDLLGVIGSVHYAGLSNVVVQFFYDRDFNPYTSNHTQVAEVSFPVLENPDDYLRTFNWLLPTTNVPPGTYALFAKVTDGARSRYLYLPEPVQILAVTPPALDVAKLDDGSFRIGVNGRTNQTIVVEFSSDLKNWSPLDTNTLTTSRWLYTNTPPATTPERYYRANLKW